MTILKWVLLIILSYALGNISVARIISRIKKDDITKHGSGNPGTMNMIRTFGVGTGLLTLFFDCLKGALPALAGYLLFRGDGVIMANTALYAAGLAVVFGHMYPVVYKLKGGKSGACAIGIFCVANPILRVCVFCASILYLYFFDYGAVFSFIVLTICTAVEAISFQGNLAISLLLAAMYFLIIFAHRKNIFRLLVGEENKVNLKKSLKKLLKKDRVKETKKEQKEKEIG